MKIIRLCIIIFICILPLFGCNVNTELCKQCVSDTIEMIELPAMYIQSDIPQGATLALSRDDGRFAVFSHPDYEITQEVFQESSWDSAFLHISGRGSNELKKYLAGNFPHEKYRCTWTVAGETGTDLCQCVIFYDGSFYYAVSVQCPAEKAGEYGAVFSDLLAGVQLELI